MSGSAEYNIGDVVIFKPEGRYSKYFGGRLAIIEHMAYGSDGKLHCRVRWLEPVNYFGRVATVSDFSLDRFSKNG